MAAQEIRLSNLVARHAVSSKDLEAVEDDFEGLQVYEVLADIWDPTVCPLFGDSSKKSYSIA
jgi:hypothetical protein